MIDQRNTSFEADDIGCNNSANTAFDSVLKTFLSRRGMLKGGVGTAATLLLGGALAACESDDDVAAPPPRTLELNFSPVAKSVADVLTVASGYTASVLYSLGDPLAAGVSNYMNNGGEGGTSFMQRSGDHHDGMEYFGLGANGRLDANSSTRGLICINHENITQIFLHAAGPTTVAGVRTVPDEVVKEINAHGVAIYEVARGTNGAMSLVRDSAFNRRITPNTAVDLAGPAAGSAFLRTLNSPTGAASRGTINNCATGHTPWGTFLTCEENWAGYFRRAAGDDATRGGSTARAVKALQRYGIAQGASGNYGWATATSTDPADRSFRRWDATQSGASADGSDDFRNEPNTFGYVVEIDPFNAASVPRKRTALGRLAHEAAAYGTPVQGQPITFYMGDDSRGEYVYKFVSAASWSAADAGNGLAAGDKYLNAGTLYAARFNGDGSGEWLPLTLANTALTGNTNYAFADLADICVNTRLAADAAGATKMDRPEWTAVHPRNGEVYVTLTNNSAAIRPVDKVDAANPRSYGAGGNVNGHILRLKETGGLGSATTFRWDIYLFGSPAAAAAATVNLSGLTDANDFSSPDGIWFDSQGVCWIQTDDSAYTSVTNCMMLAALPGTVGDGGARQVTNTVGAATGTITTQVGATPTANNLRRFLVGPKGCEITGIATTPDLKTMFVNIQHPGENT
ncbi:MAG: PhoX family phosphatase, partial [Steroidobacteraceae bacterium]